MFEDEFAANHRKEYDRVKNRILQLKQLIKNINVKKLEKQRLFENQAQSLQNCSIKLEGIANKIKAEYSKIEMKNLLILECREKIDKLSIFSSSKKSEIKSQIKDYKSQVELHKKELQWQKNQYDSLVGVLSTVKLNPNGLEDSQESLTWKAFEYNLELEELERKFVEMRKSAIEAYGNCRRTFSVEIEKVIKTMESLLRQSNSSQQEAEHVVSTFIELAFSVKCIDASQEIVAVEKCVSECDKLASQARNLHRSVTPQMDEQRNLAPKFVCLTSRDVQQFDDLAGSAYISFGRLDEVIVLLDANTSIAKHCLLQLKGLANCSGSAAELAQRILGNLHDGMQLLLKEIETEIVGKWGKCLFEKGQPVASIRKKVEQSIESNRNAGEKCVEFALNLTPPVVSRIEKVAKQIDDLFERYTSAIPRDVLELPQIDMTPVILLQAKAKKYELTAKENVKYVQEEAKKILKLLHDYDEKKNQQIDPPEPKIIQEDQKVLKN